ncbi:polysaccharide biosynthesis C-terminal domain-containing protein [Isobaculum melis]|uniref:UDP-2-acetamido-2,6-beta-L-arabino-hexul-4-ose reductase n=1 Tax=Isobaculum melis TaxID=142588 RepID=A0A1H9QP20_9LACT|nr:NAD-dependent epimerase/dehydratase family protein [Isobaculum melis]SER62202.1 UDP-2-acetamido-2,6-beta-L-arabino-hexul-4-ose reductase [Isobaculum melis]
MNILVTGSNGFLGRNLVAQLQNEGFQNIQTYNKENTIDELEQMTKTCDFVFHLAGVNRPKNEQEFFDGNADLTAQLIQLLEKNQRCVPIVLSSSIQAALENPYGQSKRQAEDAVFAYAERNQVKSYVFRLKNLFGKWSRPNYNSVVATFCYNISRDLPITINNPDAEIPLSYVDDVVATFVETMKNTPELEDKFAVVSVDYTITVGELAKKITAFNDNRQTLVMPSLKSTFDRALYATYLSYLADDNFSYFLKQNVDDRGWLAEFIKSEDNGQIFISTTKPGITRGNHWHHTKVEKFLVIKGTGEIKFRRIFDNDILVYPVSGDQLEVVDIPAGYTHSITNTGDEDMITLFWACEMFDPNHPDTYYVEV